MKNIEPVLICGAEGIFRSIYVHFFYTFMENFIFKKEKEKLREKVMFSYSQNPIHQQKKNSTNNDPTIFLTSRVNTKIPPPQQQKKVSLCLLSPSFLPFYLDSVSPWIHRRHVKWHLILITHYDEKRHMLKSTHNETLQGG